MPNLIALTVNGIRHELSSSAPLTLLDYLREKLGLTGAKNGCDGSGTCGACTVLVNGVARKSCQLQVQDLDGAVILSIEGLSTDGHHPIQQAFINHGAIQCGFCTPGMILATKALLERTPNPTREEIVRGLSGNLCRCTGYAKIIEAVQSLAFTRRSVISKPCVSSKIGAPLRRPDALGKATGRTQYADDQHCDGDLLLRVVWPSEPHARIRGVNLDEALRVPGVVNILTAKDIPGANAYGLIHRNQPVLCKDVVRFLGDPIAVVIADSQTAAEKAAGRVVIDLEPLHAVFDPLKALDPDAPRLHQEGNVVCEYLLEHGKPADVFAKAHTCVSGHFATPAIEHAYLEPEAGFAEWVDGTVIVHAAAQYPQTIQEQLADVLDVPNDRVRIVCPSVGGAFGGKTDISVHALLALAAWHTKRRVRLTWTREESLRASVKRHPMVMDYRIALSERGGILAIEGDIVANAGAYESLSYPLLEQTAAFSTGPYRVPIVDVKVRGVYTNTPTSSAFRGFGIPQPTFALESLLDEAALELGISPIELRRRNALLPGDRSATGQIMQSDTHIVEALDALEAPYKSTLSQLNEDEGVGIACGYKNVGLGLGEADHASAMLRVEPDGRLIVAVGAVDIGQGSETVLGQIAAERLGVSPDWVTVLWGDTAQTPDGRETNASRQTVVSGNAVLLAVSRLTDELCDLAPGLFPELPTPFYYESGLVSAAGERRDWSAICCQIQTPIEVSARYLAPETAPLAPWDENEFPAPTNYFAYTFFANLARVAVDRKTGRTKVLEIISAYDIGRVINRQTAEGQIEGGALMGIGFALSESFNADGTQQTDSLAKCGIPRATVTPPLEIVFVEAEDSVGPHGSKGLGEVAMIAVAPSITNAISDAVGIRVQRLPATPASVRGLLVEQPEEEG